MTITQFNILNSHIGYGNPDAKIVFLGLEEGANKKTISDNYSYRLISAPSGVGCLKAFHLGAPTPPLGDMSNWFSVPKLQPTWGHLSKLMLLRSGKSLSKIKKLDKIDYQVNFLGRSHSETLLIELLPLPRPNHNYWDGSIMNVHGHFVNKTQYLCSPLILDRVKNIRKCLITRNRNVIVYGKSKHSTLIKYFDLIGDPLLHITSHPAAATEEYKLTSNKNIRFFLCPHPVMGMTNANMIALAGLI